jgi:acyl-CoA synthetase (NDP forming)
VADTLADFADITKLSCHLEGKPVAGWRLGAISNAGFECVAMADNLGRFDLQRFDDKTTRHLEELFQHCRIDSVVEVHNPVDLTPIMDDETFENAIRAVLEAECIDVGIVGCVPLTGALNTLAPNGQHGEDLFAERSIARRLARLKQSISKPWIAVVDGGALYDPMASFLEQNDVPTFRTADRALRVFEMFCHNKLASTGPHTHPAATPGH